MRSEMTKSSNATLRASQMASGKVSTGCRIVRLVRQKVAHALRPRPFGIVVMRAAHDLADLARLAQRVVGRAQRVIEYDDALGPALGLHQRFHFRVIGALYFVLVEE